MFSCCVHPGGRKSEDLSPAIASGQENNHFSVDIRIANLPGLIFFFNGIFKAIKGIGYAWSGLHKVNSFVW